MKRFTTIFTVIIMAMLSLTLVSCDEDAEVAAYLDGTWQGNVFVSSRYNGRLYKAAETKIEFISGYNSGTGYWIDYYSNAPFDYQANHISWRVSNGNIYIRFEEEGSEVVIYDYSLSNSRLSGYILTSGGTRAAITLYHTSSPNWNSYRYGYTFYDDDYGYAKSRATASATEKPQRIFVK